MTVTIDEKTRTHVAILNEEMGQVKKILDEHTDKLDDLTTNFATLNTELAWIKWGVMLILGVVIANIMGVIG